MHNNYSLKDIPARTAKPRTKGLTMVMDKGLSCRQVEDMLETSANTIDIVKFGWATSYVISNLEAKLSIYKEAGIPVYFGGTLFEAFVVRNQLDDYLRLLDKYGLEYAEVSDGSLELNHYDKCNYIARLSKEVTVLSEVGYKDESKVISPSEWVQLMNAELEAGAWKVIGEARETGNVGLFYADGEVRSELIQKILAEIPTDKIIWEAPQKSQQVFFVKLCGTNVNLGNIAPDDTTSLETIRLGLRSDTFDWFLEKEYLNEK
ncbi:MAG: phosphosulfolactate synthase [Cytophagales bacterium]|nr:phosphosulfolactate synthase [Cytophagales bacterium]